jgi:hypothetical protein
MSITGVLLGRNSIEADDPESIQRAGAHGSKFGLVVAKLIVPDPVDKEDWLANYRSGSKLTTICRPPNFDIAPTPNPPLLSARFLATHLTRPSERNNALWLPLIAPW